MIRGAAYALGLLLASPVGAQTPAEAARDAAVQLETAADTLQAASSARDRVAALTKTIQAYETGLAAMRDGLRQAALREEQLSQALKAREADLADMLGAMQTLSATPSPVLMVHPQGPLGSARSGMILADLTPGLSAQADRLRADLTEVKTLRLLQQSASDILVDGLSGVQEARTALSKAIADRTNLPRRYTEDPVGIAVLIASTETLGGFADGLSQINGVDIPAAAADVDSRKGALDLPVQGLVLRGFGQADAAGIKRDGMVIATRPRALVTAPTAATIRYRGPLLDLGNVMILEPRKDLLIVLSGLDEVYGSAGEVVGAGTPVGLMGGKTAENGAILSLSGEESGNARTETLYIEVREGKDPVDPDSWFKTDKDG